MRALLKITALILALAMCVFATACKPTSNNGETTPETSGSDASKPSEAQTPSQSFPNETPTESSPESSPESTPTESAPESTPSESEPENEPDGKLTIEIPTAEEDLTEAQMSEIENALGREIDWENHYFGTHGGYVYFGTVDGSEDYYTTVVDGHRVWFGLVNDLYAYKDGNIVDAGAVLNGENPDWVLGCTLGVIAVKKTIGDFPSIYDDLTEAERAAIGYENGMPDYYYGIYNGYAVCSYVGLVGGSIVVRSSSGSLKLMHADWVCTFKAGEIQNYSDNQTLPDGLLTKADVARINSIHCALYALENLLK